MSNRRQIIPGIFLALTLGCGMTVSVHAQDRPFLQGEQLFRAKEAHMLQSPAGVIESLGAVYHDTRTLSHRSEEIAYLDALARGEVDASEADLKLLQFIEAYPHSSYLPYAEAKLGEWYYRKGDYSASVSWFRKVDTTLFDDEMAESTDYYYAFSLLKTGRDAEALKHFLPLMYAPHFSTDATFYAGYLQMKGGNTEKAIPTLERIKGDPKYGPYARAYIASGFLANGSYPEAIKESEQTLQEMGDDLPQVVRLSLLRSAGLANAALGHGESAVRYLEEYVRTNDAPGRLELLMLGKSLQELSRNSAAIPYLRQVPTGENDFMSQLAYYYLGLAHLSSKNATSASQAFERAASMDYYAPLTEAAAYNAALSSYALSPGRVGSGSEKLTGFIQRYPKSEYTPKAIGHLEDAFLGEPDNAKALRALNATSPLPPALNRVREKVRLGQANKSLAGGRTDEAARQYDAIINRNADPQSVAEAYLWKGEAAYRDGNYRGAMDATKRYLETRPESLPLNPNAYYTLGYAAFNLKDYAASKGYLTEYLRSAQDASGDAKTSVYNRLGDISVQARDYNGALEYFSKAEGLGGKEADESMYARAMVLGLRKDYKGKIDLLAQLPTKYPSSSRAPEALFEQGQTLTLLGDPAGARRVFERFFTLYPSSPVAPKAGLQLALSYFNEGRLQEASSAYERVIRDYPGSEEAKTALQDLKGIAIQLNRVDEYNTLAKTAGHGDSIDTSELDQMTYLAAERLITDGTSAEARSALEGYIIHFPNGKYIGNAYYSKALVEYNSKAYRDAVSTLTELTRRGVDSTLGSDVYNLLGASYDKLGESGRAAEAYLAKAGYTKTTEERSKALRLAAERAEKSNSEDFVLGLAQDVSSGKFQIDNGAKAEILGYATARYAKSNRKEEALKYAREILTLPDYGEHTMSQVIVALDLYDKGQYSTVRDRMLTLTKKGSRDAYWLARGFVLLSDAYAKLGDKTTARTYLESVRSSYPEKNDGIREMIDRRLRTL